MKLLLLAATLLASSTLSTAHVHRNLTTSESTMDNASSRHLKGKKKKHKRKKHASEEDPANEEGWAELVEAAATFEASSFAAQKYHAADGCLSNNEKQSDICLASEHSSSVAVHCCKGSMEKNNLKCSRDGCKKRSSFSAAKSYCENRGMRLCSVAELGSGACCNKGCGWNNAISWTSDSCGSGSPPTNNPANSPTNNKNPTSSSESSSGTLVSIDGDRNGDYLTSIGIMFAVEAREDLRITSISTFTGSSSNIWTEIWMRNGSHEGKTSDNSGWEKIYFGKNQQRGLFTPTEITLPNPVYVQKGSTVSFYLVSPGKLKSLESSVKEGKAIAQNDSITLFPATAIAYDRWERGCTGGRQCIIPARSFEGTISYDAVTITSPPTPQPTEDPFKKQPSGLTLREEQWLDGHNVRRKKWHEMYDKQYKPLKWSDGLKDMAQDYADELAKNCGATVHDPNRGGYGENLASNTGHGSWGELKPVEEVMYRYVERESKWSPPDNWHFTQVLWYATTHVGCADSKGTKSNGAVCRYQVCRYARTGNCAVTRFNDGSKEWWMKAVMGDSSNCKPFCPPEGC
mmetsp:Transcript_24306/g.34813  ORF Transcript_24306/g.34813 Transcript_24306/m.34813 type:complete len:573 (-) Transcript_24306:68-1786(-)